MRSVWLSSVKLYAVYIGPYFVYICTNFGEGEGGFQEEGWGCVIQNV